MVKDRTVQEVIDILTGRIRTADELFENSTEDEIIGLRHIQQDAFQSRGEPRFMCFECEIPVFIRGSSEFLNGRKHLRWHFKHFRDALECPYNTGKLSDAETLRRMKYNGAKESAIHKETKALLSKFLSQTPDVSELKVETRITNILNLREWRRLDVQITHRANKVAIEAQVSTEFVSVILDRANFYREHSIHLIWVMRVFSTDSAEQLLTQKDIIHSNNMNVFVLDDEAIQQSEERQELVLHCYYREPEKIRSIITPVWESQLVTLSELQFDHDSQQVYFKDYTSYRELLHAGIIERVKGYFSPYAEQYPQIRPDREQISELVKSTTEITPLMALFAYPDMPLHSAIASLFEHGYSHSAADLDFLREGFKVSKEEKTEAGDLASVFDSLNFASYYIKVQISGQSTHQIVATHGILDSLASLKHQTVLGFSFAKLIQVAHQMFNSRVNYFALFLKATQQYGANRLLENQDKRGLWHRKKQEFNNGLYSQSEKYDPIIKAVFPELFH
ncbi:MAG: hypothetical protein KG003_07500 [Bacteroidetes bacterium]|nr:hypothetical protein [Bacteroidota bacterium]